MTQIETVVHFAPVATAIIALLAASAAWRAVYVQRDIARRRAAIDFFLKTEMDEATVALYERFRGIDCNALCSRLRQCSIPMADQKDKKEYQDVRRWLNICELIAAGVRYKALSNGVSHAYWSDVLSEAYTKTESLIGDIRTTKGEGSELTYSDLEWLLKTKKWRPRPARRRCRSTGASS
jgi:hypothetical protein